MVIAVGSQNSAKIEAVKRAFNKVFGECEIIGLAIPSGVSDTPLTFEETFTGAKNRAKAAIDSTKSDFGVGLEGGLEQNAHGTFMFGVVAIVDKNGLLGISRGGEILIPDKMIDGLKGGRELSAVFEELLGSKLLNKGEESIGYFTKGIIDRTHGFEDLVVLALARFIRPELY